MMMHSWRQLMANEYGESCGAVPTTGGDGETKWFHQPRGKDLLVIYAYVAAEGMERFVGDWATS